ncbi:MAG TPA: hypothetical protein VGB55_14220 [Tepidisphaeraceae bacterium]|jgi:hypothetical protein
MDDEEKDGQEPKKGWWSVWGNKVIPSLAAAILTFVLTTSWNQYKSQLALFYWSNRTAANVINKPELGGKDFRISIDGKPVDNIATVTVYVFNTSGQDFEDVPVAVTFTMPDGTVPKLISDKLSLKPEQYELQNLNSNNPKELRIGYLLKVANRRDTSIFEATYIMEGGTPPTVNVDLNKKGIRSQFIESNRLVEQTDSPWSSLLSPIGGTLLTFFIVAIPIMNVFLIVWLWTIYKKLKRET